MGHKINYPKKLQKALRAKQWKLRGRRLLHIHRVVFRTITIAARLVSYIVSLLPRAWTVVNRMIRSANVSSDSRELENVIRQFLNRLPRTKMAALKDELAASSGSAIEPSLSFVGASRRSGNPSNRLDQFLDSVMENTFRLDRVEVLVRIDDDDDLYFFLDIKRRYREALNLRIYSGPRYGYCYLHRLVSELIPRMSEMSQAAFGFADDCILTRNCWDQDLALLAEKYSDGIYFVNTLRDYRVPRSSDRLFFMELWQKGPSSLFPIVSRGVLNAAGEGTKKHAGWTYYGNTLMCDSFLEALAFYIEKITGENRVLVLPNTITQQPDIGVAPHKEGGLFSQSPVAVENYRMFLLDSTQRVIWEIAKEIARRMSTSSEKIQPVHPFLNLLDGDSQVQSFPILRR